MSPRVQPEPRWEAWRCAEASIGDPAALEEACRELPPRQAWILRSIAALDHGDRRELGLLALRLLDAGEHDLVCLLRLTLIDPGEIDPTDVRRRAKALEIPNGPGLPTLDLIRLFAVAMAGAKPSRPPSLASLARKRPVLDGVLPLLSSSFTLYEQLDLLLQFSRRLAEYWTVMASWTARHHDVRESLRACMENPVASFPERDWPDLGGRQPGGGVERWLASPREQPWNPRIARQLELLCLGGTREVRRRILGGLLRAIHEILSEGHPAGATGAVDAAIDLADSIAGLANHRVLQEQLVQLGMRLDWWGAGGERPLDLLIAFWAEMRNASTAERQAAAREIIERALGIQLIPQPVRGEVLLEYVLASKDLEERAFPLLIAHGKQIGRRVLMDAVARQGDDHRSAFLLGAHALANRDTEGALRHAAELCGTNGGMGAGEFLVVQIIHGVLDPRRRPSRRLRRAFEVFLDAVEAHTPTIHLAALLPMVMSWVFEPARLAERLPRIAPSLQRALESPRGPESEEVGDEILLLAILGEEERGRERIREVGRYLRRHVDAPRAWSHAVHLACVLSSAPPPRPPLICSALEGISAFLLHRGSDALLPAVRSYLANAPEQASFFALWVQEHRGALADDPLWDVLENADGGDELVRLFDDEIFDDDLLDDALISELLATAEENRHG